MIILQHIAFTCIVVIALSQSVNSLACYVCNPCEEPFNPNTSAIGTQPDNRGFPCRKIWTPQYVKKDIDRDCVQANVRGTGLWCCQTDYCNDTTKVISTTCTWLSVVVTILMKFF